MINKWTGSGASDVACMFRTDNLEAWLKAISEIKKKYHIKADGCRWLQMSEKDYPYNKRAIFSFCTVSGKREWESESFVIQPDFVFSGFPEGVKYYE